MTDTRTQEMMNLLNTTINLAHQPNAPIANMLPIDLITSSLGIVVDEPENAKGVLVGALAWIVYHHWDSVGSAIREANGHEFLHSLANSDPHIAGEPTLN